MRISIDGDDNETMDDDDVIMIQSKPGDYVYFVADRRFYSTTDGDIYFKCLWFLESLIFMEVIMLYTGWYVLSLSKTYKVKIDSYGNGIDE
ncbi:hypothetical protein SNE40_023219 [Patella caerulea]|uniref:Uncharacterized protein n=1 Tax=Patella caerulea TaxID=87958 RepID=A0AAN8IWS0_PATCE